MGLYFGDVCRSPLSDEYVLALLHFRSHGTRYDLVVDVTVTAACHGRGPSPINVALYGRSCRDRTVSLSTVRL